MNNNLSVIKKEESIWNFPNFEIFDAQRDFFSEFRISVHILIDK